MDVFSPPENDSEVRLPCKKSISGARKFGLLLSGYFSPRGGTQVTHERTLDPSHRVMSSYDIAEKIRESLPGTEEIIVQYLSGYLVDEASEDEDILQVARYMLESVAVDKPDVLEQLMGTLSILLQDQLALREKAQSGPKLQRLDKVLDMSKTGAMSNTIALSEGVDLESINKGKCVRGIRSSLVLYLMDCVSRASRVDVKKLEKQEAKLKAKIEKRARRDLYEGSKLLEQAKKQVRLQLSFHLPRVSDIVWPKAILRGNVHEGALGSFPPVIHLCWSGGIDQPPAIYSSLEKQKQGHSSPVHRRLLWLEPYPVRTPYTIA